ncbi:unnamed protein product, partial [Ectocarpus sp. 12 AP-2014]
AGGTEFVLALLQEMHRRGVPPDAASYSGAIIACDLAGMWREAVGLLDDMLQKTGVENRGGHALEILCVQDYSIFPTMVPLSL